MLILCCQSGFTDLCRLLVEFGADVNAKNLKGNTPLHYSLTYGFSEISRFLIAHGADEYATNSDGLTCYEGLSMESLHDL